jgi:hypothetical protein
VTGASQLDNNETSGGAPGTSDGGAIYNLGQVTIQNASLDGNLSDNGGGAALYNGAVSTASVSGADLNGNQAEDGPGGAVRNLGALTITASTLLSNTALTSGGAISNIGTLSLLNTTIGANGAGLSGAGLYNNGQARLDYATLAENSSPADHGLATTGALTASNSLLSDSSGAPNCAGSVFSLGHNLIRNRTGCTLSGPGTGDKLNLDPKLTGLIDQGGVLGYFDLQHFSPALDAADPAPGHCPATDQRGVARPIGVHCDIGAIESSTALFYLFLPLVRR